MSRAAKEKKAQEWKAGLEFPYAVVRSGGKQYCVSKGDMVLVEKLEVEAGTTWTSDDVLFVAQGPGKFQLGKPTIKGAKVTFEVLQQTLDEKIKIRHHRRRQNSQKTLGHRQPLTRLLVKSIEG
ncbi:MAG: 50S ribosomal protein L21 [Proteobacteria bacterium]|jgi:large subunit ribosomal protein L21|nr:50S ribosomal protein L21 [Pseudomonadota bacterium]